MNFRKHISLFLAILLLVSNVGFAFNVHYCGGKIASISLKPLSYYKNFEKGCCEIDGNKNTCCKDKEFSFQKKSDDTTVKSFSFQFNSDFFVPSLIVRTAFLETANFKSSQKTSYYCDANAPPLFKLYSQYIFYA